MKRTRIILFFVIISFVFCSYSQVQYGGSANYGLRKIITTYTGSAIQVRRSCDNATVNVGFTSCGDIDTNALRNFVLVPNPISAISSPVDAIYSLRRMRCAYVGSAIQVRRSSDNTTSNIGFTANGDLDTITLKTFVGAGNGFITIWYDQSVNGYNLTQSSNNAYQPRIINAGVVDRPNGANSWPGLYFDGVDDYMTNAAYNRYLNSQTPTWNAVIFPKSSINVYSPIVSWRSAGSVCSQLEIAGSNNWNNCWWSNNVNWTTTNGLTRTYDAYQILTHFIQATASQLYYNGTLSYNNTGQSNAPSVNSVLHTGTPLNVGVDNCCGGRFIKGYLNEIVLSSLNFSNTDREYLEWSQSIYYGVNGPVLTTLPSSPQSAYITGWYDQSGNGNALTQLSASRQPEIMNAGIIWKVGTKPAIKGTNASQTNLTTIFGSSYTSNLLSANCIVQSDLGTNGNWRVMSVGNSALTSNDWNSNNYFNVNQRSTNNFVIERNGVNPTTAITVGSPLVLSLRFNGTNRQLFNNGTGSGTTADANSFNFNALRVLQSINPGFEPTESLTGRMSEFGFYYSSLSTTRRRLIESNQSAYFNISIANGKYTPPTATTYNRYVLGIGRENGVSGDSVCATRQSVGMGFTVNTNGAAYLKDDGDYITAGMDCPTFSTSVANIVAPIQLRWQNDWYIVKTDVGTAGGTVSIYFDFVDYYAGVLPGAASGYSLLNRPTPVSNFSVIAATPANVSGSRVYFTIDANNITTNSYFTIGSINPPSSPLPIEMLSFAAFACKEDVCINWKTASEQNSERFEVERSVNADNWMKISEVKAAGNNYNNLSYSILDNHPLQGLNYYRLKQVDKDQSFKYSKIEVVEFKNELEISIYPNPSNGTFNINNCGAYDKLSIKDLLGRSVYFSEFNANSMLIDLNQLEDGCYFVNISNSMSNKKHISKIIIDKN